MSRFCVRSSAEICAPTVLGRVAAHTEEPRSTEKVIQVGTAVYLELGDNALELGRVGVATQWTSGQSQRGFCWDKWAGKSCIASIRLVEERIGVCAVPVVTCCVLPFQVRHLQGKISGAPCAFLGAQTAILPASDMGRDERTAHQLRGQPSVAVAARRECCW